MKRNFSRLLLCCVTFFSLNALAEKDWTMLVFINGHNNLSYAGDLNINQLETVGSSDDVNFVVQWASMDNVDHTKRLLVQKDSDPNAVTSPVVEDIGRADMGSAQTLKDFLLWGIEKYPAKHYFVVVWDHGTGWHLLSPIRPKDISHDDVFGTAITTEQLGQVMRDVAQHMGRKIDLYGSDACLMAMAEIAGEMEGAINYFLGSEDLEPADGWPYHVLAAEMVKKPTMTTVELANILTKAFVDAYPNMSHIALSAFDMSLYGKFEQTVKALGSGIAALSGSERAQVLSSVKSTLRFEGDYGDLADFSNSLLSNKSISLEPKLVTDVQSVLKAFVVANNASPDLPQASGLTIWLPDTKYLYEAYKDRYAGLRFQQATNWSAVLANYLY